MSKELKYRKHIRLRGFDYSSSHYYFVTVCTKDRGELFVPRVSEKYGHEIPNFVRDVAAASYAAENTKILKQCIRDLQDKYYENLEIDFYVIMQDHIHLIIAFHGPIRRKGAMGSRSYKLHEIITALKAMATRDIGHSIWQPNYYEHIIRSEDALDSIRTYILHNPWIEYDEINWKTLDPL